MSESSDSRTFKNTERLLRGNTRPVIAFVSFLSAFLFAALPFAFNTDHILLVAPCVVVSFSCSILFIRLIVGELGLVKWILLGTAVYLAMHVGSEWYVVALLTLGTVVCSLFMDILLGDFVPISRMSKK